MVEYCEQGAEMKSRNGSSDYGLLIAVGVVIIALGVGYLCYQSYQNSFEYKTIEMFPAPQLGITDVPAPAVEVGYVTADGWQVSKIDYVNKGYVITYRRKR